MSACWKFIRKLKFASCSAETILVNFSASMTGNGESSREDRQEKEDASDVASLRYTVQQTRGKRSFGPLIFNNSCCCSMSLGRGANPMVL